jgi:dCMP deaminase
MQSELSKKTLLPQKQLKYDVAYLKMAIEWSKLSHCKRKKVGAIIVKEGMIISDGYNGTPSGFCNDCEDSEGNTYWYVLHAEANAILKVAKSTNNAKDATLYLTHSPCKDCSKLILQSGIIRLVFLDKYKDVAGIEFLQSAGLEIVQIKEEAIYEK